MWVLGVFLETQSSFYATFFELNEVKISSHSILSIVIESEITRLEFFNILYLVIEPLKVTNLQSESFTRGFLRNNPQQHLAE